MLLCEETLSVLDMLKPKVALVEEACQCEYSTSRWSWIHYLIYNEINPWCFFFFFLSTALRESTLIPSFCRLILDVGNFLNYVSCAVSCFLLNAIWKFFNLFNFFFSREVTQEMP